MKGTHVIIDMWDCEEIPVRKKMEGLVARLCEGAGAVLLNGKGHDFENAPNAYTFVFLLAESHIAMHTWPEANYVSFCVYTCGDADAEFIADSMIRLLRPKEIRRKVITRGIRL